MQRRQHRAVLTTHEIEFPFLNVPVRQSPDRGEILDPSLITQGGPMAGGDEGLLLLGRRVESGLVVRSPWVEYIQNGRKTWELRGTSTAKRGWIALIRGGSKTIIGICRLERVIGPLTREELIETIEKHLTPPNELETDRLPYPKTYAWVLSDPQPLPSPLPYRHPSGAVIWVSLRGMCARLDSPGASHAGSLPLRVAHVPTPPVPDAAPGEAPIPDGPR